MGMLGIRLMSSHQIMPPHTQAGKVSKFNSRRHHQEFLVSSTMIPLLMAEVLAGADTFSH